MGVIVVRGGERERDGGEERVGRGSVMAFNHRLLAQWNEHKRINKKLKKKLNVQFLI